MKCTNCGTEFALGRFCPNCGTPAPEVTHSQSSLASQVIPPEPERHTQSSLASQVTNTMPVEDPEPVRTYVPTAAAETTYHPPIAPVKRKKRSMAPVLIALVLVAALVVGALAIIKTGPINSIVSGAKNVLDSGSFTVEMSIAAEGQRVDYLMMVEFDPEEEIFNMLIEMDGPEGVSGTLGLYEGYMFSEQSTGDGDKWYEYYEVELDELFENYLEYSDEVGHIFDSYRLPSDKDDILFLLEELDDAADGMLSKELDLEILADCLSEYQKAHNDKKWLEENADFSQSKEDGATIYTYEPDLYDFFSASLPYFEEAFEDDDLYDEGMDAIDDSRSDLKSVKMEVSFGVKSGYLTSVTAEVMGVEIEVTLYNIGKTELSVEELEDLMDECKVEYDKQYEDYYGDYTYND